MNKFYLILLIIALSVPLHAYGNTFKSKKYQKTIAIDLDSVLNNYNGKFDENSIPEIKQGAKEFLEELYKKDYRLILFTNRKPLTASKWLIDNKIDKYFFNVTNVKPVAFIYLDDGALNFKGNYPEVLSEIEAFEISQK